MSHHMLVPELFAQALNKQLSGTE